MTGTAKAGKSGAKHARTGFSRGNGRKRSSGMSQKRAKGMADAVTESAGRQLRKLGKSVDSAKKKELMFLRDISKKVRQFAEKATQLTKLKIEIHNLKEEHKGLLGVMGENLWNMHKAGRITRIRPKFRYDLNRLQEVEAEIREKKKTATRITTFLKNIK